MHQTAVATGYLLALTLVKPIPVRGLLIFHPNLQHSDAKSNNASASNNKSSFQTCPNYAP